MGEVKRQTALGHLVEIAAMATDQLRFRGSEIGWPVEQLWVAGDLLSTSSMIEVGTVVVVIDVPAEQMSWLALNPAGEWAGEQLRLRKRSMHWCYRPFAWPAWNHEHRRLVRFWSADDGLDDAVIDALRTRRMHRLDVVEPSDGQLVEQLRIEWPVSASHLREIVESYWDRDWRRQHKGFDGSPEDHLWRAAAAVSQIQVALEQYGI
jgi:hypothetical protein